MYQNDYRLHLQHSYDSQLNAIYHHGVLGMKWGVRRYRNPDGTMTELGKRHEAKLRNKELSRKSKAIDKQRQFDRKNASAFSDDELKRDVERIKKEKEFRDLVRSQQRESVTKGQEFLNTFLRTAGAAAAVTTVGVASGLGMFYLREHIYKKYTGHNVFTDYKDYGAALANLNPKNEEEEREARRMRERYEDSVRDFANYVGFNPNKKKGK